MIFRSCNFDVVMGGCGHSVYFLHSLELLISYNLHNSHALEDRDRQVHVTPVTYHFWHYGMTSGDSFFICLINKYLLNEPYGLGIFIYLFLD